MQARRAVDGVRPRRIKIGIGAAQSRRAVRHPEMPDRLPGGGIERRSVEHVAAGRSGDRTLGIGRPRKLHRIRAGADAGLRVRKSGAQQQSHGYRINKIGVAGWALRSPAVHVCAFPSRSRSFKTVERETGHHPLDKL